MRVCVFLLAACLCLALALPAATVSFGSDLLNESNSVTGANVAIRPHPLWAAYPPYQWVSYADTGHGPGGASPPNSDPASGPTASFFEQLPPATRLVRLTVFADDTAAVYLLDQDHPLGLLLAPANWSMGGACARGPIGCEPGEGLLLEFFVNQYGPAVLRFDVFQRGRGPFGVLYAGDAELAHSAEALPVLLVGTGLVWIIWRRRKGRNPAPAARRSASLPATAG